MSKLVHRLALLPAPAERWYDMYVGASLHAVFAEACVVIRERPGSRFRTCGNGLPGRMLSAVPKRMIAQA